MVAVVVLGSTPPSPLLAVVVAVAANTLLPKDEVVPPIPGPKVDK